jgi:DNA-binding winged helix-turn-helix (wHTH) protein/TolB-like protein
MLTGRVQFGPLDLAQGRPIDSAQGPPFTLNVTSGELWRDGAPIAIQDLPFRLLVALLERPGELVTRAELVTRLWGTDTFVDAAAGLNTAVAKLREALGDQAERPAYIETVPKRGYRFVGSVESSVDPPAPMSRGSSLPIVASGGGWIMLAAVVLVIVSAAVYQLRADRARVRVAVVLFDNETGDAALSPFAQGLTDATVTELTAEPRLAVIGNAAVLRTSRPFRDIQVIREALNADYIVIGQVQMRDGGTIVRAHLIRARDQSHVWVDAAEMRDRTETAFQADVAGRIRAAVTKTAIHSSIHSSAP